MGGLGSRLNLHNRGDYMSQYQPVPGFLASGFGVRQYCNTVTGLKSQPDLQLVVVDRLVLVCVKEVECFCHLLSLFVRELPPSPPSSSPHSSHTLLHSHSSSTFGSRAVYSIIITSSSREVIVIITGSGRGSSKAHQLNLGSAAIVCEEVWPSLKSNQTW